MKTPRRRPLRRLRSTMNKVAALRACPLLALSGIGLSLASSYSFAWAHGEVTGLINAEKTVEGWGLGDTIPRAQIGWTSGAWSNTFYLTGWLPTGNYERGFEPNTGKNCYGVNSGWGITYTEPNTKLEFDSRSA